MKFDHDLAIGHMRDAELADYLASIGDDEGAKLYRRSGARGQSVARMLGRPYASSAHVYGFIAEGDVGTEPVEIVPASSIEADRDLIGSRIKVTLDGFRVAAYPGLGLHTVLFDFTGRHQAGDEAQDLRFASVLKVNDNDNAAISGVPIFTGLMVPSDGLSFQARTISIVSSGDEAILEALQSSVFRDGLRLLGHFQPALPQLVGLAAGVTETLIKRGSNKVVQSFDLGLDFSKSRTSGRLRRGSYVVTQVPDSTTWRWKNWRYDPSGMNIIDEAGAVASYNTIIFAVSASEALEARSAMRSEGAKALDATQTKAVLGNRRGSNKVT